MKISKFLTIGAIALSFVTTGAFAQDKAKQQAEVREKAQQTLNDFYKAEPKLRAEVQKSAGYAVFTTYGFSFLLGGSGGKGLVHDYKTKRNTYMELAQASAGLQLGATKARYLFVFKNEKAIQSFISSGWEAGVEGGAGAGAGKTAGGGTIGDFTGGKVYSLTEKGLQGGGMVAGTKVWKDKDLN